MAAIASGRPVPRTSLHPPCPKLLSPEFLLLPHGRMPGRIFRTIGSFLGFSWGPLLRAINRLSREMMTRMDVISLLPTDQILGTHSFYIVKRTVNREEATEILSQTGIRLAFEPGMERASVALERFGTAGEEAYIGFAHSTKSYVVIKILTEERAIKLQGEIDALLRNRSPHLSLHEDLCRGVDPSGKPILYAVDTLRDTLAGTKVVSQMDNIATGDYRQRLLFSLAEGLFKGLSVMHGQGTCHLGIRPENLTIKPNGLLALTHFESARRMGASGLSLGEFTLNKDFLAPEGWISLNSAPGFSVDATKLDLWAAGLTLLIWSGEDPTPFFEEEMKAVIGKQRGSPSTDLLLRAFKSHVDAHLRRDARMPGHWSLIAQLLEPDPRRRSTADQALNHPWIKEMQALGIPPDTLQDGMKELVTASYAESHHQSVISADYRWPLRLGPTQLPFRDPDTFIKRQSLLEQLVKEVLEPTVYERARSVVCKGKEGIGKHTLIADFISRLDVRRKFSHILWFRNGECEHIFQAEYLMFAEERKLRGEDAPFHAVIARVQSFLEGEWKSTGKPWLVVIEKAVDECKKFFPNKGGQFIYIAKASAFKDSSAIAVEEMSKDEAATLVDKCLGRRSEESSELSEILKCRPLLISQASTYIRNKGIPVLEYASCVKGIEKEIKRTWPVLLHHCICYIWELTLVELAPRSPRAIQILQEVAYLSPDHMTDLILDRLAKPDEKLLLYSYGIIDPNNSRMHPEWRDFIQNRFLHPLRVTKPGELESLVIRVMRLLLNFSADYADAQQKMKVDLQVIAHGTCLRFYLKDLTFASLDYLENKIKLLLLLSDTAQRLFRDTVQSKSLIDEAAKTASEHPARVHSKLFELLASHYHNLKEFSTAVSYFERALKLLEAAPSESREVAAIKFRVGNLLCRIEPFDSRRVEEAIGYLKDAESIIVDMPDLNDLLFSTRWGLVEAYKRQANPRWAIIYLKRILASLDNPRDPRTLEIYRHLGLCYSQSDDDADREEALSHFREALSRLRRLPLIRDTQRRMEGELLFKLGYLSTHLGKNRDAVEYLKRALAIFELVPGNEDGLVTLNEILSQNYALLNEHEHAKSCIKRALGLRRGLKPDPARQIHFLMWAGDYSLFIGDYTEAKNHFVTALGVCRTTRSTDLAELSSTISKRLLRVKRAKICGLLTSIFCCTRDRNKKD